MNGRFTGVGMALLLLAYLSLATGTDVRADEQTLTGTVTAKADDDGKVTSAEIATENGDKVTITLDEKGKKLAAENNGKKVEVKGDVAEQDGKKTITVKEYKASE